jgi:thiamine biosynthesis lipoprotein
LSPSRRQGNGSNPERFDRRELVVGFAPSASERGGHWIRVHRPAMACLFEVTLGSEEARFVPEARAALDEVDALEATLSVFRESSELARVNRDAASGPVTVSADLVELLGLCRDLHRATGGAFDPTSTPLSREWGFLGRQGRLPSPEEIAAARARVGMERVVISEPERSVGFASPGMELNLGSIGKGWALDQIARTLRGRGLRRGLVNAGGSSFLGWGVDHWTVTLSPGREPLANVHLRRGALGTSGVGEQSFEIEGRRFGHVIDPRTGWPVAGVRSATVVTADAAVADALATAFLVGGSALARAWCAERPGTLALLVTDEDPRTLVACGARDGVKIDPEPDVRIEWDEG